MSSALTLFTAVLCGALIMVLEIMGARLLAPYFGMDTVVWTFTIGTIMAAMACGYAWGGGKADRGAQPNTVGLLLLLCALWWGLIAWGHHGVLRVSVALFGSGPGGLFIAAAALLAPPSALLAAIAPMLARFSVRGVETSGSAVGRVYAAGTVGSIIGTFACGLWLLPFFGHRIVLMSGAFVLAMVGTGLVAKSRVVLWETAALGAALIVLFVVPEWARRPARVELDSAYTRIRVTDHPDRQSGRVRRVMAFGAGAVQGGVFVDNPNESVYDYTRYFEWDRRLVPKLRRALMIGGGAYVYPRQFLKLYPQAEMDVVELDPVVTAVAKHHFFLKTDPRLRVHHVDARIFLNQLSRRSPPESERYDVIYMDAYRSTSVPFHLATEAVAQHIREALRPDGVALFNVIASMSGPRSRLLADLHTTFASVFSHVAVLAPQTGAAPRDLQNLLLIASHAPLPQDVETLKLEVPPGRILTDDFAPVDYLRWGML